MIHNHTVFEYRERETNVRTAENTDELAEIIAKHFGIASRITREVTNRLGPLGDAWD